MDWADTTSTTVPPGVIAERKAQSETHHCHPIAHEPNLCTNCTSDHTQMAQSFCIRFSPIPDSDCRQFFAAFSPDSILCTRKAQKVHEIEAQRVRHAGLSFVSKLSCVELDFQSNHETAIPHRTFKEFEKNHTVAFEHCTAVAAQHRKW